MTPDDYQTEVARTCAPADRARLRMHYAGCTIEPPVPSPMPAPVELTHCALGITKEGAEILGAVEKFVYYGRPLDTANVREEAGDVLWYLGKLCNVMGWRLEDLMAENAAKLRRRYPDGYTDAACKDRADREATELPESMTEPFGKDYLGGVRQVPHENDAGNRGKTMNGHCRYCGDKATCELVWFRGPFGKPGPVTLPYCGSCDISAALRKRGMTAPVSEGRDYRIVRPAPEPAAKVVQDGHGFGHAEETGEPHTLTVEYLKACEDEAEHGCRAGLYPVWTADLEAARNGDEEARRRLDGAKLAAGVTDATVEIAKRPVPCPHAETFVRPGGTVACVKCGEVRSQTPQISCTGCGGTGEIEDDIRYGRDHPCTRCNGTGRVS